MSRPRHRLKCLGVLKPSCLINEHEHETQVIQRFSSSESGWMMQQVVTRFFGVRVDHHPPETKATTKRVALKHQLSDWICLHWLRRGHIAFSVNSTCVFVCQVAWRGNICVALQQRFMLYSTHLSAVRLKEKTTNSSSFCLFTFCLSVGLSSIVFPYAALLPSNASGSAHICCSPHTQVHRRTVAHSFSSAIFCHSFSASDLCSCDPLFFFFLRFWAPVPPHHQGADSGNTVAYVDGERHKEARQGWEVMYREITYNIFCWQSF